MLDKINAVYTYHILKTGEARKITISYPVLIEALKEIGKNNRKALASYLKIKYNLRLQVRIMEKLEFICIS